MIVNLLLSKRKVEEREDRVRGHLPNYSSIYWCSVRRLPSRTLPIVYPDKMNYFRFFIDYKVF